MKFLVPILPYPDGVPNVNKNKVETLSIFYFVKPNGA